MTIYLDMLDYIVNNDMSVEANYLKVCELIDIRSFIDCYAYEIYIDNADWSENNVALWRVREATREDYCDDAISNLVNATQNISEYSVYRFRSIKDSIIEYNSNFLKDKEEIDSTDNEIKNINEAAYILLLSEFGNQDTKILLNGLEVGSNDGEWVGEYFVGTEVKLEALAKGDKKFIGWKINDASEYIEDRNALSERKFGDSYITSGNRD